MTDIAVETTSYLTEDRSWLIDSLPWSTEFGRLDFALFTAGTHYPNGFLFSGIVLGKVTTGGLLGPYNDGASDGRQTAVGILYNATKVPTLLTRRVSVAYVRSFAAISVAKLATGNGLDAAGQVDLKLLDFRA
jgi:hypothetical protein